jgi:hypothetical protein
MGIVLEARNFRDIEPSRIPSLLAHEYIEDQEPLVQVLPKSPVRKV